MKPVIILILILACLPAGLGTTLGWSPNTNSGVVGYKIYWGTASRSYVGMTNAGKTNQVSLVGTFPGRTNYFTATTLGPSNTEGYYSVELAAFVDTNVYATNLTVLRRHVRPLLGAFSVSGGSNLWQRVAWFTNDDAAGAVTSLKPFLAWGAESTNWPVATNLVVFTNLPPDSNGIQNVLHSPVLLKS